LHIDLGSLARDPWLRALLILLTAIAALYLGHMLWVLIYQVADLMLLFIVAWLVSFVLEPAVAGLTRFRWLSRTWAVLLIYVAVFVGLTVGGIVLLPELAAQSAEAANKLPEIGDRVSQWASGAFAFLADRGIAIGLSAEQILRPIETIVPGLANNILTFATGAASTLVQVLLVIVLSVFFLLDSERIGNALLSAVPDRYRGDFIYFVSSVYRAFGGFIRGQIIQAFVYGVGVAVIMLVWGLPFVALASVLAGLGMFIPFFGPVLGIVPPVTVAVLADPGKTVLVFLLTWGLNFLIVNVVAPKVMSRQIGLHPIIVLTSVLVGFKFAGPWGAIFGVPVAAVIAAMASFYQLTRAERRERVLEVSGSENGPSPTPHPATPVEPEPTPIP
jgi:predicted PurR-regulated permease PerM